jgi:hypothetical protein
MYISTKNFPEGYSKEQRKKLVLKALPFTIIDGKLYKQGKNQILCQCLHDGEISIILWEMHKGVGGEQFSTDITTQKVLCRNPNCRNPTLAKCGGEAQHFQSWGLGVLWDSRMFRARQKGPKHLALRCSWCLWKGLEA